MKNPWETFLSCVLYMVLALSLAGMVVALMTMRKHMPKRDTIIIEDDSERYGAEYALLKA